MCIVAEYCDRGSLYDVLQNKSGFFEVFLQFRSSYDNREIELDWETRRRIALGAARGVVFLHNNKPPILHRDLKR